METLVFVLMILVCFNFILKQTFSKKWVLVLQALVCALFVGFMYPYAIGQSKAQITLWLENISLMQDTAVVLCVEVVLQLSYCMLAAHLQTTDKVKPRIILGYKILRWFPGLLIFPVLFSLLVTVIFAFPGVSFAAISWSLAFLVFVAIIMISILLRLLLPEKELRLELLFLSNSLIAILGIVATVNGRTATSGVDEVDWASCIGVLLITLLGTLSGMVVRTIVLKRKSLKK